MLDSPVSTTSTAATPTGAGATSVVRLVPDLDQELRAALERIEEFLLLIDAWVSDAPEEAPPSPIGDGTALAALRRIGRALRPTQGRATPRLFAADGHYEHLPLRPVHVQQADLTALANSVQQLRRAPDVNPGGLLAEAIEAVQTTTPIIGDSMTPPMTAEADRLNRLLTIDPTDQTSAVWDRLRTPTPADTTLTPREEIAYRHLADQITAAWYGNDPISRWIF